MATSDTHQLSGGQKAVVALSLVLAFQRCSQAPICILDEVDAAIDSDRRKKLALLIAKESQGAQYITTTFRKELLATGNQVWSLSQTISVCFFSRTKLLIGIEGKSMMAAERESSGRATCSSKNFLSNPTRPAV